MPSISTAMFFQRVLVGHLIDKGNQDVEPCFKGFVELAQALHDKHFPLGNHPNRLEKYPSNKDCDYRPSQPLHYFTSTSSTLLFTPLITRD
jgi:hypothetical protein